LTAQDMLRQLASPSIEDVTGKIGRGLARIFDTEGQQDLVLLMAGTNDLAVDRPDAMSVFERVRRLHEVCHARGVPTVALAPPGPMPSAHRAARLQLSSMLAEWAQNTPGVVGFADCEDLVPRSPQAGGRVLWDPDDIHMNPDGSRTLGQRMLQVVLLALEAARRDAHVIDRPAQELRSTRVSRTAQAGCSPVFARRPTSPVGAVVPFAVAAQLATQSRCSMSVSAGAGFAVPGRRKWRHEARALVHP